MAPSTTLSNRNVTQALTGAVSALTAALPAPISGASSNTTLGSSLSSASALLPGMANIPGLSGAAGLGNSASSKASFAIGFMQGATGTDGLANLVLPMNGDKSKALGQLVGSGVREYAKNVAQMSQEAKLKAEKEQQAKAAEEEKAKALAAESAKKKEKQARIDDKKGEEKALAQADAQKRELEAHRRALELGTDPRDPNGKLAASRRQPQNS